MRNLASTLGIQAMSLYYHIKDKDELLDRMVESVVGEIDLPATDNDWRGEMERRAVSARAALGRHPWTAALLVSRMNVGKHHLAYIDRSLACLISAGFTPIEADLAIHVMDAYIYGHAMIEGNFPVAPDDIPQVAHDSIGMISAESHPALEALSRLVIAGEYDGMPKFDAGFRCVIQGLASAFSR